MPPLRTHDRSSFFKYMTADTARLVLANRTLRWSSPLLFNDPFDVPRELYFDITPVEIANALTQRLADLISSSSLNTQEIDPSIQDLVAVLKKESQMAIKPIS